MKLFVVSLLTTFLALWRVTYAEEIQETARRLMTDPDALFEMYQQHKEAKSVQAMSPLQSLLERLLEHAEQNPPADNSPKHILTILTDDQGYADIGYHDSTFISPTMDAIAHRGVKLSSYYVQNTCSPTRASLLTGRTLGQTGLQGVIIPGTKRAMRDDLPTIGTVFKSAGYSTNLIGKWHLGHTYMKYTPNERGYDNFFGSLGAMIDHFSKESGMSCLTEETDYNIFFGENCSVMNAYDLQENGTPHIDTTTFAGDLFAAKAVEAIENHDVSVPMLMHFHHNAPHTPLQPPDRMYFLCDGVSEGDVRSIRPYFRQKICGLVAAVDLNILQVVLALAAKNMLSSTLILFHSDNGGFIEAGSLNLPFNHQKSTYYEGGVRVPAFMYLASHSTLSANFGPDSRFIDDIFDVTDVLPTLMGYAGISNATYDAYPDLKLDGYNHWDELTRGSPLSRTFSSLYSSINNDVLHYSSGYIAIINGTRWKYGLNSRSGEAIMAMRRENYTLEGEVLFNLDKDPEEKINLVDLEANVCQVESGQPDYQRQRYNEVLNELREKSTEIRMSSLRSATANTWPPRLRLFPSPLGCTLPLDSPLYNTFKCMEREPFVPQAWRDDPDPD